MDKEQIKTEIAMARSTLQRPEASLAETEKPKLQKGDYGTKDRCLRFVVVAIDGNKVTFLWEGNSDKNKWKTEWNLSDIDDHFVFLGNIFDYLKAIAEPLKEFTLGEGLRKNSCRREARRIVITPEAPGSVIIDMDDFPGFILNLRRLLHTAEQE